MISVLTLTYKRHHFLQECIQSFLEQDYTGDKEMVIVNDAYNVEYYYEHPQIRIYNLKDRFSSIGQKLKWGMEQCKGEYIYRLDDDDLLTPWGLSLVHSYIEENPDYDVYRCMGHYFYNNYKYEGKGNNVNNGNTYRKSFLQSIEWPDASFGEDTTITFYPNSKVYNGEKGRYSMIYRWGMGTTHVSGMGNIGNKRILDWVEKDLKEDGVIHLQPHFTQDYYTPLEKDIDLLK